DPENFQAQRRGGSSNTSNLIHSSAHQNLMGNQTNERNQGNGCSQNNNTDNIQMLSRCLNNLRLKGEVVAARR
ncbi:hypothetical protein B0H17DRAFT_1112660, partial [Mycena rosella]